VPQSAPTCLIRELPVAAYVQLHVHAAAVTRGRVQLAHLHSTAAAARFACSVLLGPNLRDILVCAQHAVCCTHLCHCGPVGVVRVVANAVSEGRGCCLGACGS
jgi:hypothetical protein